MLHHCSFVLRILKVSFVPTWHIIVDILAYNYGLINNDILSIYIEPRNTNSEQIVDNYERRSYFLLG